jgi:hypothetical protein
VNPGTPPHHPQSVANVLDDMLDSIRPSHVASLLLVPIKTIHDERIPQFSGLGDAATLHLVSVDLSAREKRTQPQQARGHSVAKVGYAPRLALLFKQ